MNLRQNGARAEAVCCGVDVFRGHDIRIVLAPHSTAAFTHHVNQFKGAIPVLSVKTTPFSSEENSNMCFKVSRFFCLYTAYCAEHTTTTHTYRERERERERARARERERERNENKVDRRGG